MKQKKFISNLLLLLTAILALTSIYSCSEEELIVNEGYNSSRVKVVDNVVHFANLDAFHSIMSELHKKGRQNLKVWEDENSFSYSYRKVLDNEQSDSSIIEKPIIEDPFFATVVNQDGVFVVEDTIYKITLNNEYIIPELDFSKLAAIDEGENLRSTSNIISRQIKRKEFSSDGLRNVTWWNTRKKNSSSTPPVCSNNLSAHLKCWSVNYFLYGSIGIRISGRKYKRRKWRDDDMWYAKVDGCAVGGPTWSTPATYCGSNTGTNTKNVSKTLLWIAGTPGSAFVSCEEITCDYTYEDDGCPRVTWTETWN